MIVCLLIFFVVGTVGHISEHGVGKIARTARTAGEGKQPQPEGEQKAESFSHVFLLETEMIWNRNRFP